MSPPNSVSDSLDSEEWDFIAHTLMGMKSGVEPRCAKTRRLRTELGVIRTILYEEIREWNGKNTIELSFLIGSFKSIRRIGAEFESLGIKKTEFLIFLELLLNRFEKQKIEVKRPLIALSEFKKMKGVVEDESGPL